MYQVLYRKYRPNKFSDVYGQPHIVSTLLGEIRSGRIAHAYLFTGTRGTGKTTCAKILAKAVNCLNPQNGDPCGECEICKSFDSGDLLDVVEVDAASNNGVDYIRDLRETANFTPAKAKYRVYIIDEVHMLSDSAFNALLKTLEEPPEYMIFILATTEVHKVPATILSRCQRFDFHRIPVSAIASRIKYVAKNENIDIDDDAVNIIARFADGALRDALSLLDRCVSAGGKITAESASAAMGTTGRDHLFEISSLINSHDTAGVLSCIDRLYNNSKDMTRLCVELTGHYRDMMLAKMLKKPGDLINCTPNELTKLLNAAEHTDISDILRATELLQTAQQNIKSGSAARIELEIALLKLADKQIDASFSLEKRIEALEKQISELSRGKIPSGGAYIGDTAGKNDPKGHFSSPSAANSGASTNADSYNKSTVNKPATYGSTDKEGTPAPTVPGEKEIEKTSENAASAGAQPSRPALSGDDAEVLKWPEILSALKPVNPLLAAALKGSRAVIRKDILLIDSENPMFRDILRSNTAARDGLKKAAATVLGSLYRIGPYSPPDVTAANTAVKKAKGNTPMSDELQTSKDDVKSNGTFQSRTSYEKESASEPTDNDNSFSDNSPDGKSVDLSPDAAADQEKNSTGGNSVKGNTDSDSNSNSDSDSDSINNSNTDTVNDGRTEPVNENGKTAGVADSKAAVKAISEDKDANKTNGKGSILSSFIEDAKASGVQVDIK